MNNMFEYSFQPKIFQISLSETAKSEKFRHFQLSLQNSFPTAMCNVKFVKCHFNFLFAVFLSFKFLKDFPKSMRHIDHSVIGVCRQDQRVRQNVLYKQRKSARHTETRQLICVKRVSINFIKSFSSVIIAEHLMNAHLILSSAVARTIHPTFSLLSQATFFLHIIHQSYVTPIYINGQIPATFCSLYYLQSNNKIQYQM